MCIIIDEAHERTLNIDFLLGYLKRLLAKRHELKLIITSATIDTLAFPTALMTRPSSRCPGAFIRSMSSMRPYDANSEETGDMTYIDAAVHAAQAALAESGAGDLLVFMPSERDIRETADMVLGRFGNEVDVIPLFGRLSAGDQQRAFAPSPRHKIVIATNIAETSLTIPGIKYVMDSGLARISRYNPRTRTKRLPIEPVSQSSANQRKGRSGRVQNGICIRLYSEEEFHARPPYTQPEIQRANLAEVILRMKAFRLGEIETFPFLNPPTPAAIQAGYRLLQELGALDRNLALTTLGRDLARLPIDPTLGRMLLQSHTEHATRELLIIASGLSIQDPRERPLDRRDAADALHKRFADPQSDFLTLLHLWNALHDQWETLRTQNQRRKYCQAHFLSYTRMREWQDLHAQLEDALHDINYLYLNESNAAFEAIHRSILAGLLGHVAKRKEANCYTGTGNRELTVFPGSTLFRRVEKPKPGKRPPAPRPPAQPPAPSQPDWVVAGELVETSQLFARTLAGIDPQWIIELAPHLCKVAHRNPHWSAAAAQVLVEEITTLYGLEIRNRQVGFGNIDPKQATEIFVRSALVEGELFPSAQPGAPSAPDRYPFLQHNRSVRQKIETWQTRSRRHDLGDLDQALFDFYVSHLQNVSSVDELNRFLRDEANRKQLLVTEADLVGAEDLTLDTRAFPDSVSLGGQPVPLSYAYTPGEENDGVTVRLPADLTDAVSQAEVEWAVPGLREPQVSELLRSLPKAIRRSLMPFAPKVADIAANLRPGEQSLAADLSAFIFQRYGVPVPITAWAPASIPTHLRPRIEITDRERKTLGAGRNLVQLREQLEKHAASLPSSLPAGPDETAWANAVAKWERFGLTAWTFGDLPARLTVLEQDGQPVFGYPGLQVEEGQVNLRIFRSDKPAHLSHPHRRSAPGRVGHCQRIGLASKGLARLFPARAFARQLLFRRRIGRIRLPAPQTRGPPSRASALRTRLPSGRRPGPLDPGRRRTETARSARSHPQTPPPDPHPPRSALCRCRSNPQTATQHVLRSARSPIAPSQARPRPYRAPAPRRTFCPPAHKLSRPHSRLPPPRYAQVFESPPHPPRTRRTQPPQRPRTRCQNRSLPGSPRQA